LNSRTVGERPWPEGEDTVVLPEHGQQSFGVYVHVPFCRRRCDYCAFATWTDREHLWERYVAACRVEVGRLAGPATRRGPATSVFFGGGTPSLLPAELLVSIIETVRESVGIIPGAEVTVECNPETVSAAKLDQYRAHGVTRLSFGAQSMVPHVLRSLGREHDPGSVRRAVELAGEAGYADAYNLDLIFGAAGETMADWRASLDAVLGLGPRPAHVSAYALTVEPGTPLATQPSRHPSDDDQADKYLLAEAVLTDAGFEWYEISNWATSGARCAHNLLYWSQGEYRGIGCAAHSHRVSPDGSARRWWNVRTPERYCRLIEAAGEVEAAGETLGPGQRAWEQLVLSLRTRRGVPAGAVPDELFDAGLVELGPVRAMPGEVKPGDGGPDGGQPNRGQPNRGQPNRGQPNRGQPNRGQPNEGRPNEGRANGARAVLTPRGRLLANEVAIKLVEPVSPR
jgi:putative oxygen-independent coproporphyrinogen III oxidase